MSSNTNQDKLIAFIDDPETIKKAVEGSLDKRIANMDAAATTSNLLDTIRSSLQAVSIVSSMHPEDYRRQLEAILQQTTRIMEAVQREKQDV